MRTAVYGKIKQKKMTLRTRDTFEGQTRAGLFLREN